MRIEGAMWDGEAILDTDKIYHSVCLSFHLKDDEDAVVIIPLKEINIDSELLFLKRTANPNKYDIDWDSSLHAKQEAVDIMKGWIAEIERQIEQDKKAKEEEAS